MTKQETIKTLTEEIEFLRNKLSDERRERIRLERELLEWQVQYNAKSLFRTSEKFGYQAT